MQIVCCKHQFWMRVHRQHTLTVICISSEAERLDIGPVSSTGCMKMNPQPLVSKSIEKQLSSYVYNARGHEDRYTRKVNSKMQAST